MLILCKAGEYCIARSQFSKVASPRHTHSFAGVTTVDTFMCAYLHIFTTHHISSLPIPDILKVISCQNTSTNLHIDGTFVSVHVPKPDLLGSSPLQKMCLQSPNMYFNPHHTILSMQRKRIHTCN